MALEFSKLVNTQKTKLFWLYIVLGALLTVVSIMFMPFWKNTTVFFANWGYAIINIIIAFLIVLYLTLYLFKKVMEKGNGVVKVLTIIEFSLLSLIAIGCVISQFNLIKINEPCQILGLALWLRGSIEIFKAYYYDRSSEVKYSVVSLIIALIFVTVGVYFMVSNAITKAVILWIVTCSILLVSIIVIILGVLKKPKKQKQE